MDHARGDILSSGRSPPVHNGERLLADGSESSTGTRVVMVVDDDEAFARTVRIWLEGRWDVTVVHDGDEAAERYGRHVDAVLLDRRMPRMTGDDALAVIREQDGDAGVALLSAVQPEWDDLDLAFDRYLTKPVTRETVVEAVEELHARTACSPEVRAICSRVSKLDLLEATYPRAELDENPRYQRLLDELERLWCRAEATVGPLDREQLDEIVQRANAPDRTG